jgi:hypothetical protein
VFILIVQSFTESYKHLNTVRTGSFKLFNRPFPEFLQF